MDHFSEQSYSSYGENIGNSFKGIFFGIVLLIISIILLWWNEGRSVEQATALKEMQEKIITLPDTTYNDGYENQAVLLQGLVKPLRTVVDREFNVTTDGLVLHKKVQMYQWKEKKESHSQDKLGGGTETITTYDYVKVWSTSPINSSNFKHFSGHSNPTMERQSETFATPATLGEYSLDESMVKRINADTPYNGLEKLPNRINSAKNYKSFLYIGFVPDSPQIGDIKITYSYAPSAIYTYASKVFNKSLVPYITTNKKSFVFVRRGKVEADVIFTEELKANAILTWILRVVGLFLMFIGFNVIMAPLATLAKVVPLLGSLVGGATALVAVIFTLVLGSIVIALAWFTARPIVSIIVLVVGFVLAFFLKKSSAKKDNKEGFIKEKTNTPTQRATPPPRRK